MYLSILETIFTFSLFASSKSFSIASVRESDRVLAKMHHRNEPIAPDSTELRQTAVLHLPEECKASPWAHRDDTSKANVIPFLQFLTTRVFWDRLEYAIRVAFVGVLPVALLAYHPQTTTNWVIPGVMMTFCIVVSSNSVAQSLTEFIQIIRALILSLVLAEIAIAIDPGRNWIGWGAMFAGVNLLVGLFTSHLVTKLGLFGWTIFMVLNYEHNPLATYVNPAEYIKQNILAAGFGLLTAFFPYPYFETWRAEKIQKRIFSLLSCQLQGLTECAWTNNLDRSAHLVSIRQIHREIENETILLTRTLQLASMEFWFRSRVLCLQGRMELILRLIRDANSVLETLENINRHATEWDNSIEFQQFGSHIIHSMREGAVQFEWFLSRLAVGECTPEMTASLTKTKEALETKFTDARHAVIFKLLDEVADGAPFTKYPFLSSNSFLFPWKDSVDALATFKEATIPPVADAFIHFLMFPVRDLYHAWLVIVGLVNFQPEMVIRLREALKLSFAMTTAVALLINVKAQDPAGGAAVIGFLMDADPSNNVLTGVRFLLGCIFGSVFGLLCNSVSRDLTELIIWTVVIAFTTGFGKSGPKWGQTFFFIMFFGLSAMGPGENDAKIIKSIQQNVVAITWLVIVSNVAWPTYPSTFLHENVQTSIAHSRRFITMFLSSFSGKLEFNQALLHTVVNDVRLCAVSQAPLIEAASEEPSVRTDSFPSGVYVNFNKSLRRCVSHFYPMVTAGAFLTEAEKENPMMMMEMLKEPLGALAEEVNVLLRMLEEYIHEKTNMSWGGSGVVYGGNQQKNIDAMLAQVTRVRKQSELAVWKVAQEAFMVQWKGIKDGSHKAPTPYQVPAAHMILGGVSRLTFDLYELVLATIAIRNTM